MCNACGYLCCARDTFDGCGCDCRLEHCGACGDYFDPTLGDACRCDDWACDDWAWEDDQ